jgi:hypothetical protein
MLLPEGIPKRIADEIRIAIKNKRTWTPLIDIPLSEELIALLLTHNLRIVYSRKDQSKYKIYVPYRFRTKDV